MSTESKAKRRAFNVGCDSRIAGRDMDADLRLVPEELRLWFCAGWRHADKLWGADSRGARPLPSVQRPLRQT